MAPHQVTGEIMHAPARSSRRSGLVSRILAGVSAGALLSVGTTAGILLAGAGVAVADTAPPLPSTPATVSADALPTVQINGVVWSQVTVGNTVYATGSFTSARPAGAAAGVSETPRGNLLAYDITTGNLITSFNHSLNAQGLAVSASPDGSKVYVVGDFTSVDGAFHSHIAAFSTGTGALISGFNTNLNSKTRALAVTNSVVYAGGNFTAANGAARTHLVAVNASTGALLAWAPTADDGNVLAMVMTPDQSKVVVGGNFTTLSGAAAYGLGAVDSQAGTVLPWAANQQVQNAGANAAIDSLRTDGKQIYGTGYVFGAGGNLEGTFAADPGTGNINWVQDCHGDSYDTFVVGSVLYNVSHSHYCGNIGSFPQTNPWGFHRATAFTTYPTGTISHDPYGYHDWYGTPSPTQLDWYPDLDSGSYTGQHQGAWSATGNSNYLALGGEFPRVNSTGQQGLVRFAIKTLAPNKLGPRVSPTLTPSVVSLTSGTARVAWTATWDQDNEAVTYKVVRDGQSATPVFTTTVGSTFYRLPAIGFTDTGLLPGSTHSYRVFAYDAFGNANSGSSVSATVTSASASSYATDVRGDRASSYWRLGESTGTTGYDWAGYNDLTEQSGVGHGASGAIGGDANGAASFDGSTAGSAATAAAIDAPSTYSLEAWIKTTSTSGGKIIGFGNTASGNSSSYDRHLYLDNAGHLLFGVYNNGVHTVSGPAAYNDGAWHHIVASQSGDGMVLYVDGLRVGSDSGAVANTPYSGYWRVGGDNLGGWPAQPTSNNLAGAIDDVAVYPVALNATQIRHHYSDSGRTANLPAPPTDTYGKAVYADHPDLYWRLDEAGGSVATDASENGTAGAYLGGVTNRSPSPVTGPNGTGVSLNGNDGLVVSQRAVNNPTAYSEELWFTTTTRSGGKLIGFGNATSGTSSNYDRHVWMLDTGQLVFGTYTGQTNTAQSPGSYNDGAWHHLVAAQGADGMHLYVDGAQVAANPQTAAQNYTGYWRVGGDNTWGGASSNFFAGTVDEVAVYPTELSSATVHTHYRSSPAAAAAVNTAPLASFTSSCTRLTCSFDGSGSSDPDGTVTSYAWNFGDGSSAATASPAHSYTAGGVFTVALTVTDNQGAASTVRHDVTVTAPPANQPPVSRFAQVCSNLSCSFDGSGSSDPDGSVASYAWDFGDGAASTAVTPSHAYAVAGDYVVTLTVTDDTSATGSSMTTVSPRPPANPAATRFASDAFARSTSNGLGNADTGGAWTTSGTASNLSVANGAASFRMPTASSLIGAYLGSPHVTDSDVTATLTTDKAGTGSGMFAYVAARRVGYNNEYRARVRLNGKSVGLALTKLAGSASEGLLLTEVTLPGISYTPGMLLNIRTQVTGVNPTTVRARVWPANTPEPAAWQLSTTDTTPTLQAAGGVGLAGYLLGSATNAPIVLTFSAFAATPTSAPAPTASFLASCAGQSCKVDGSASSDPSGPVTTFQWSWGDGVVSTGKTSAHDYGKPGTYRVTLTVTNGSGLTDVTTRTVTVPG